MTRTHYLIILVAFALAFFSGCAAVPTERFVAFGKNVVGRVMTAAEEAANLRIDRELQKVKP